MDFIERWLHVSPDGGNGMAEAGYLALLAAAVGLLLARRWLVGLCRRASMAKRFRRGVPR